MSQKQEYEIDREVERIALADGRGQRVLFAMFNMLGGVAGLISLLTVALLGGELKRQIEVDTKRLDVIEVGGSPAVQALSRSLTAEIEMRREVDLTINKRIDETNATNSQRIQNITSLLERLVDQTTKLISLIEVQQKIDR